MNALSHPAQHLPSKEFLLRLQRLQRIQKQQKLDAIIVLSEVNRYYLTGLNASNGVLFSSAESAFYTDSRYLEMARKAIDFLPVRAVWRREDEPDVLQRLGRTWQRVGYEGSISVARFQQLQAALPAVEWVDVTASLNLLRAVKSRAEVAALRRAFAATDAVFAAARQQIVPGMTEWTIRNMIRRGADFCGQGEAFDTIVCAGAHAAEPHHHPDDTIVQSNDAVLIDMGVKKDLYCSDMTRCFTLGRPRKRYLELKAIVAAANKNAIRAVRPGVPCSAIDARARGTIEKAGYGRYFQHSTGHSLGLEIHEWPTFSPSCEALLAPGMVLSVEPGIYLPGQVGVRIEDVVLVTRSGCEVLTRTLQE